MIVNLLWNPNGRGSIVMSEQFLLFDLIKLVHLMNCALFSIYNVAYKTFHPPK